MSDPILPPPILGILPGGGTTKLVLQVLAAFAAAGLLIFAVWFVAIRPHQAARAAAQAQTDANGAEAQAKAAEGSVVILRDHDAEVGRIQQQTESNSHDIHQAPGAGDHLSPDLDRAGRRALCLHDGRANEPQCEVLLHPHG
jgi:uncharacterized protein HemX